MWRRRRLNVDPQQLESHVQMACAHNPRGFVFQSTSALSGVDDATQQRVAALQLINRRLQLIEPWLAGGKVVSQVDSSDGAEIGVLLHVDQRPVAHAVAERAGAAGEGWRWSRASCAKGNRVHRAGGARDEPGILFFADDDADVAIGADCRRNATRDTGGRRRVCGDDRGSAGRFKACSSGSHATARKTVQLERDLAARRARAMAYSSQRLVQVGLNAEVAAREAAAVNQQLANGRFAYCGRAC